MPLRPTSIAEEISQRIPFRSQGQEAMVALLRSADDLRHFLNERIAASDVTLQQYNVLRILKGAGSAGLPTLEIGERMVERQPGVTRLVDRLIDKGFVERSRGQRDRRQVLCRITTEGLGILEQLDPGIESVDDEVARSFDRGELEEMIRLLDLLRAGLRERRGADGVGESETRCTDAVVPEESA